MNMLGLALVHPNILGLALLAFDWAAEKGASLAGAASPSAFSSGAGFATREENKSPSPAFLAAAVCEQQAGSKRTGEEERGKKEDKDGGGDGGG